jgi:hypothetical protein
MGLLGMREIAGLEERLLDERQVFLGDHAVAADARRGREQAALVEAAELPRFAAEAARDRTQSVRRARGHRSRPRVKEFTGYAVQYHLAGVMRTAYLQNASRSYALASMR